MSVTVFTGANFIDFGDIKSPLKKTYNVSDVGGLKDALVLLINPVVAYTSAMSFYLSITNGIPTAVYNTAQQ